MEFYGAMDKPCILGVLSRGKVIDVKRELIFNNMLSFSYHIRLETVDYAA
ncbi:hypothetical protein [Oceanobacillus alkalisoli]|nr:hypothetical protein [Oceanobacillus alkalisoli]MCF3944119.1 hypothetical protein [Oceanobacillus alkalisoli]MCG5102528.1 hypothetical protein [Oceanobacillus alkalisoli]